MTACWRPAPPRNRSLGLTSLRGLGVHEGVRRLYVQNNLLTSFEGSAPGTGASGLQRRGRGGFDLLRGVRAREGAGGSGEGHALVGGGLRNARGRGAARARRGAV